MSNISIKPISELLQYNFFIPSYQRGYRWTKNQTTDLLDDIWEFILKPNKKDDEWYCLQPIVVTITAEDIKNQNDLTGKLYDVIDGQQRLTTMYLILKYLEKFIESERKTFDIQYQTRKDSKMFLNKITEVEEFESEENIDYYHIYNSYKIIEKWFKKKANEGYSSISSKFVTPLLERVKIIWYEISIGDDSIDIFTRINSGKIPLTNAELIKALFLNSSNFKNADRDKLRLKQLEIASEWDRLEYALQDDVFWYFINKSDNNLVTRIEFIFSMMYQTAILNDLEVIEKNKLKITTKEAIIESQEIQLKIEEQFVNDEYSTFRFFSDKFKANSEDEIHDNWKEIKKQFQLLEEWFYDRELYHKIGFLITIGVNIQTILNGKQKKSKSEFNTWITEQIIYYLENVDIDSIEYNKGYVREVLLLHNIQTMLDNKNESSRFPFDRFKKEHWDVEHIHAIATKVKVKKEEQTTWLKNNFVETKMHSNELKNRQIQEIISFKNPINENDFNDIIAYVLGEEDNGLQNLCLLDRGTNRSYKNDGFKEKRKKIIQREILGTFIPISTKNLFMKYYSDEVLDIEIWNDKDRKSYLEKIHEVLNQYLPKKVALENEQ